MLGTENDELNWIEEAMRKEGNGERESDGGGGTCAKENMERWNLRSNEKTMVMWKIVTVCKTYTSVYQPSPVC